VREGFHAVEKNELGGRGCGEIPFENEKQVSK